MPTITLERELLAPPSRISRAIVAPLQLQLAQSDMLRVKVMTSVVGSFTVVISFRILTPEGAYVIGEQDVPLVSGYTFTNVLIGLREGYLLAATATVVGAVAQLGQVYVQAYVTVQQSKADPTDTTQDLVLAPLIQGFVTSSQQITWPGSLFQQQTEANWYRALYTVTAPAAGANWSISVPNERNWQPLAISARFTTSAAPANRQAILRFQMEGASPENWSSIRTPAIVANSQVRCVWAQGTPHDSGLLADTYSDALPANCLLLANVDSIDVGCANIQAGDQWDQIQITVREQLALI